MKYLLGLACMFLSMISLAQSIGLHIDDSQNVLFGDSIPGPGDKLIWIPAEGAFWSGGIWTDKMFDLDSMGRRSFVGGGANNTARGQQSFVGGGTLNSASDYDSFVGGGHKNSASENRSFVGGGELNSASGDNSFIGGGARNSSSAFNSFVGGGQRNMASGRNSFVGGGEGLFVQSRNEAAFGSYNLDYTPMLDSTDRLFVIGNGTSAMDRSNAMTVLKSGLVGIGTATPDQLLTLSAPDEPILRFERSDPDRWDWEVYAKGGHLHFRGGADTIGTSLTDLVTFQSDSSIVVAGLAGMGERDLCVDAEGRLKICASPSPPPMGVISHTPEAIETRQVTIDFKKVNTTQQFKIDEQQQEIEDLHTRVAQLEKLIMNTIKSIQNE